MHPPHIPKALRFYFVLSLMFLLEELTWGLVFASPAIHRKQTEAVCKRGGSGRSGNAGQPRGVIYSCCSCTGGSEAGCLLHCNKAHPSLISLVKLTKICMHRFCIIGIEMGSANQCHTLSSSTLLLFVCSNFYTSCFQKVETVFIYEWLSDRIRSVAQSSHKKRDQGANVGS